MKLQSKMERIRNTIHKLSKGNPDLPMTNLKQLYGILRHEPLTLNIFIHLLYQLLMEITPGNQTNDINLICPQYTEKLIYIANNPQPQLQDFNTMPLGTCCDLVLNTSFCDQNKHKTSLPPLKKNPSLPIPIAK